MAACWKLKSEESTEWAAPSFTVAFTPITGKPISPPLGRQDRKPLSQEGMYSVGMRPVHLGELVAPRLVGLDASGHPGVLPVSPGLLLVGVVELRGAGDGFPVAHLRLAGLDFGPVLPLHALQVHLQVQLAQAADDRFTAFARLPAKARREVLSETGRGLSIGLVM
jgi:hypothetical protein